MKAKRPCSKEMLVRIGQTIAIVALTAQFCVAQTNAERKDPVWNMQDKFLEDLVSSVPGILKTQDGNTGRFGSKPWICSDQNVVFALAAAWSIDSDANPYYHSPELLQTVSNAGKILVQEQDEDGRWTFRKKDNSTWGQIHMPWTYSRWIRAFVLIRDAMPAADRAVWEKGLLLGYEQISKRCLGHVHNIPTHHAMGLYCAGTAFGREEWKRQAAEFMKQVVAKQSPAGWWSEHSGPVVGYNFVYVDALGVYYAMSGDKSVLPALRKAAIFHASFTYPDGSKVETIDERNPYHRGVAIGNVGFSFTPEGRGFLNQQLTLHLQNRTSVAADYAASMILYGQTGDTVPPASQRERYELLLDDGGAMVRREGPWFICMSAYTAAPTTNRWIQDRQNFLSVYHDELGLIVGGGNTKLQPNWSSFTIGDKSLLSHTPGDTNPDFKPKGDLLHVPDSACFITDGENRTLELVYGKNTCRIRVDCKSDKELLLTYEVDGPIKAPAEAHVVFLTRKGVLSTQSGRRINCVARPFRIDAGEIGDYFDYEAVRVRGIDGSYVTWPNLPHNPYKRDGSSKLSSARLVLCLPFDKEHRERQVRLYVMPPVRDGAYGARQIEVLDSSDRHTRYIGSLGIRFLRAEAPGDSLTLAVDVNEEATYEVGIRITRADSYGILRIELDGEPFEKEVDAYAPDLQQGCSYALGKRRLKAGRHKLRLVVTGKNADSKNHYLGIEAVTLRKAE